MKNIDSVLSEISDLSLDEKELIEEILHKRIIEEKRDEIYNDFQKDLIDYESGKFKSGNTEELFKSFKEVK